MKKEWKNLSDKELDQEFRKASKYQSIPFRPKDWELMQAKLDSSAFLFPLDQVWVWGIMVGVMLLVGLHLVGPVQNAQFERLTEEVRESMGNPTPDLIIQMEPNFEQVEIFKDANKSIPSPTTNQTYINSISVAHRPQSEIPELIINAGLSGPDLETEGLLDSAEENIYPASPPTSRLSLTLMASPDISAFRINEIHGLGTNVGIYLEYFLNKNLSVVTGAIYGNKTYRTSATSGYRYPTSYSFWDGECQVLDILVNLRYYAIERPSGRWYLSGGVSSYIMLREKFAVTTESGGQVQTQQIDIRNQNRNLLGIINFSIGYERQLNNKWAIQVEPFVKVPLSGVGEGDINLKSTGVWLGIKHQW